MSASSCIVLKFGGSVLAGEGTLTRAVHEVHRWRREGRDVVCVVSALAGETNALARTCSDLAPGASPHAVAAVLGAGEARSAALLGLLLDRAGIPSRVLGAAGLRLRAVGDPLGADPTDVDTRPIRRALVAGEVALVPGFLAIDADARPVTLGRGGSDLTALFLAQRLGAEQCRLVKDVDGVYAHDPGRPGPRPSRYRTLSWEDALETDGTIVQHRAVRFAREHGLAFELGRLEGERPTVIGPGPTTVGRAEPTADPLGVAVLGGGTVGGGVAALVGGLPDRFRLGGVLVRELQRPRDSAVLHARLTRDPDAAFADADVVVEALGGVDPAYALCRRALERGCHVVTANKALVATRGAGLRALAEANGLRFLSSAAVGGAAPVLERLSGRDVRTVRGVLNGTANFVLEAVASGRSLGDALEDARRRGFAEADATRDLDGRDAADKLQVAADVLGFGRLDVERKGDVREAVEWARSARAEGQSVRQVATLRVHEGRPVASVALEALADPDPLARAALEWNVVEVWPEVGEPAVIRGRGAGRWPTAESVLGDLAEIARTRGPLRRAVSVG